MRQGSARIGFWMTGIAACMGIWACRRPPATDHGREASSSTSHVAPNASASAATAPSSSTTGAPAAAASTDVANDADAQAQGVPTEGTSLSDFVPPGWTVRQKQLGSLGGSPHPDAVLEIVRVSTDEQRAVQEQQAALVVLLGSDSGWTRVGFSLGLSLCAECGGAVWGVELPSAGLDIRDGMLEVDLMWGARDAGYQSWSFRYEAQSGRLRCISMTKGSRDRLSGASDSMQWDYLTGQVVETEERIDERGNLVTAPPRTRRESPEVVYFEDVAPEVD
jgi:hypothetical protein